MNLLFGRYDDIEFNQPIDNYTQKIRSLLKDLAGIKN